MSWVYTAPGITTTCSPTATSPVSTTSALNKFRCRAGSRYDSGVAVRTEAQLAGEGHAGAICPGAEHELYVWKIDRQLQSAPHRGAIDGPADGRRSLSRAPSTRRAAARAA